MATAVVGTDEARDRLVGIYDISPWRVRVIGNGTWCRPVPIAPPPRGSIISWGLLRPDKGLERAISAVARLTRGGSRVHYTIAGRTEPETQGRSGFAYRRRLEYLVGELNLGGIVEFVDRHLPDEELAGLVGSSDVVVMPYDAPAQVTSGVLSDTLGMGRPIVATPFPAATGSLANGAGLVVSPEDLASGLEQLLGDEALYQSAAAAAASWAETHDWASIASHYLALIDELLAHPASA
jgi:glycosyltransferase involved in cell wall biosynthesis